MIDSLDYRTRNLLKSAKEIIEAVHGPACTFQEALSKLILAINALEETVIRLKETQDELV